MENPDAGERQSVGLLAAHDSIRYRRSLETLKLYMKKQGQ
jgi:hypothetical protein